MNWIKYNKKDPDTKPISKEFYFCYAEDDITGESEYRYDQFVDTESEPLLEKYEGFLNGFQKDYKSKLKTKAYMRIPEYNESDSCADYIVLDKNKDGIFIPTVDNEPEIEFNIKPVIFSTGPDMVLADKIRVSQPVKITSKCNNKSGCGDEYSILVNVFSDNNYYITSGAIYFVYNKVEGRDYIALTMIRNTISNISYLFLNTHFFESLRRIMRNYTNYNVKEGN